jgi:hypothetical protein
MQYRNDLTMARILDANQFDDSKVLTLRIAVAIPYMTDQSDFQRVNGKFEHRGEFYRLLKQKYAKDTLTVICVRDHENERISEALSNYVKTFTDNGSDSNESQTIMVSFIKDFLPQTFSLLTLTSGWNSDIIKNSFVNDLTPTFTSSVIHPPERA